MKSISDDIVLITYFDLKRIFLRHFALIKRVTLFCGLIAFVFLSLREPVYQAEASFRQLGKQTDNFSMKEIFQQILPAFAESGTVSIMNSNEMLRDVVETLGLQMHCNADGLFIKALKRIWENLTCELGGKLTDKEVFRFSDVVYTGENSLKFFIRLTEEDSFELLDRHKAIISEGKVGQPLKVQGLKFTLSAIPKYAKTGSSYSLQINPWLGIVTKVKKKLSIRPFKLDKNILQLSFSSRDRYLASSLLNQIMYSYQKYLKRENEELYQTQLAYLRGRQEELVGEFDHALSEHVTYLTENLGKNGFIGFAEELETLSHPKNEYVSKLFSVDVELKRFLSKEPRLMPALSNDKWRHQALSPKWSFSASPLVQVRKDGTQQVETIDFEQKHYENIPVHAQFAGERLRSIYDGEDFALQQKEMEDFAGLALDTAQKLAVEYTEQRDRLQAEVRELAYLKERLINPDFELSSLGSVLNSSVTNDLVQKASAIALQLQDNDNRSEREQERLQESLKTQKSFLSQYILQTIELKQLRIQLLEDKIAALHRRIVDLLRSEKGLLGQKLQEINIKMRDLPEKWRRESLLMLKKEIGSMMIHAVSQLTESKFLGQNIFQVASKPLDFALPPSIPRSPHVLFLSVLASLLGALGCYLWKFSKTLWKGLPLSQEALRLLGFPVSGSLSRYCQMDLNQVGEEDLETVRRLSEFLAHRPKTSQATVAACVGGKYFNYTQALAEILALRGMKVLVVQCVFDQTVPLEQRPGLWQYLQGEVEEIPIRRSSSYDVLTSGGTTRHGAEWAHHAKFSKLLTEVKPHYDIVLLFTSADAAKSEGVAYLHLADAAIVSVQQEKKEDLTAYWDWAQKKDTGCVTFLNLSE